MNNYSISNNQLAMVYKRQNLVFNGHNLDKSGKVKVE